MGKWSHYKKTYSIKWESDPDLKYWISPYETDPSKALCKYCNKAIRAHLHHLKGHARSRRHRIRCPGYEETVTPCTMPEDSFDHSSKTEISKSEITGVQSIVSTSPDVQHPTSTASMIQTAWDLLTINTPSVHSPSPQLHQSDPTLQQFTVDGNLHLPFSTSATATHSWVVVAINPGTSTSQPSVAYATVMERTFVAIKPEGVQRGLMNKIIKRFEQKGFRLVAMKFMLASEDLLKEHYSNLKDRPFFPGLVKYMSSSPVVPMVWEGPNVVKTGRAMLGETNPVDSRPGTIRWDYAIHAGRNVCHCSDSVESAQKEISLWFKPEELIPYTSWAQHWLYEENLSSQRHVVEASLPTEAT